MMPRPNRALKFAHEGPLRVVGHIWWQKDGRWRRYVVRRHARSESSDIEETHLVQFEMHFCPHCLHQPVTETRYVFPASPPQYDCPACGMRWHWVDEPRTLAGP